MPHPWIPGSWGPAARPPAGPVSGWLHTPPGPCPAGQKITVRTGRKGPVRKSQGKHRMGTHACVEGKLSDYLLSPAGQTHAVWTNLQNNIMDLIKITNFPWTKEEMLKRSQNGSGNLSVLTHAVMQFILHEVCLFGCDLTYASYLYLLRLINRKIFPFVFKFEVYLYY